MVSLRIAHISFAIAIFLGALTATVEGAQARENELRPVRATLGCIEYRNWQSNLVKTNPNLRHYHWNPIYANIQGTRLVGPPAPPKQRLTTRPKKQELAARPKRDEAKRQPTAYVFRPAKERPSVYKQPSRMAPQAGTRTEIAYKHAAPHRKTGASLAYKHVSPQLSHRDANGRLIPNEQPKSAPITAAEAELRRKALMAKLEPPRVPALTAPQNKLKLAEKSVSGTLAHKDCHGQLAHKQVEGQLVAKACCANLVEPTTATYGPYTRGEGASRRVTRTNVDAQVRNY